MSVRSLLSGCQRESWCCSQQLQLLWVTYGQKIYCNSPGFVSFLLFVIHNHYKRELLCEKELPSTWIRIASVYGSFCPIGSLEFAHTSQKVRHSIIFFFSQFHSFDWVEKFGTRSKENNRGNRLEFDRVMSSSVKRMNVLLDDNPYLSKWYPSTKL